MSSVKPVLVAVTLLALALSGGAAAANQSRESRLDLAQRVEQRAAATSFPALEAFGESALDHAGREGLNRLYHVMWITLNQGDFERAKVWNDRLAAAALARRDERYQTIARLNDLTIRYDSGDTAASVEMDRIARTTADWFVKAHAMRITALALMDQDRIGDGLRLLTEADAAIPESAPYADTARAGLWEVTGIGLMKLNDIEGATTAFRRFEVDFSNPAYPRPDFDALYNLTRLSVQVGDQDLADRLYAAHHRLSRRSGLESLMVYDANLCAMVAEGGGDPRAVLNCLSPYGADLGAAEFLARATAPVARPGLCPDRPAGARPPRPGRDPPPRSRRPVPRGGIFGSAPGRGRPALRRGPHTRGLRPAGGLSPGPGRADRAPVQRRHRSGHRRHAGATGGTSPPARHGQRQHPTSEGRHQLATLGRRHRHRLLPDRGRSAGLAMAVGRPSASGAPGGGGGQPLQERLPRQYEPRNPHAPERRRRHGRRPGPQRSGPARARDGGHRPLFQRHA